MQRAEAKVDIWAKAKQPVNRALVGKKTTPVWLFALALTPQRLRWRTRARHGGVLDVRGRPDFSRFDPSPGEAPL